MSKPGEYEDWNSSVTLPTERGQCQAFEEGTKRGTFHDDVQVHEGDVVATEHWGSSGFPNTDLSTK